VRPPQNTSCAGLAFGAGGLGRREQAVDIGRLADVVGKGDAPEDDAFCGHAGVPSASLSGESPT